MKLLIKTIEKLISILFISMCALVFLQVVLRYFFNRPIFWIEDYSLSVFTWVSFVGAALALRKSRHARITVLIEKFPPAVRTKVEIGGQALVAVLSCMIFIQSLKYNNLAKTFTLAALKIPQSFVSSAITFGSVMMFVFSIEAIVDIIRKKNRETGSDTIF